MLILQRQRDVECAALAFAALSPDVTAVAGHKLAAKIKPQAKPFAPALTPTRIALEQAAKLFFGDTATLIMHRDQRHQSLVVAVIAGSGVGGVACGDHGGRLNADPHRHTRSRRAIANRIRRTAPARRSPTPGYDLRRPVAAARSPAGPWPPDQRAGAAN